MIYNFPIVIDGKEYKSSTSLADYLANNFRKSLELIKNGSLFNFLQSEDPDLHQYLVSNVVDFEYVENILTLTIYMLDTNRGIVTKGNHFKSNYDIAEVMKAEYPNINRDAYTLFKDKVLALIFWNEYEKRNDNRYKRNYTFMLHIYENRIYDFTYFYYLFLHLDKNEKIRFMIDGIRMNDVSDIPPYLCANYERAGVIIDEILSNAFILAMIAIAAGIDMVSQALESGNKYAILKPIAKLSNVDLTIILERRMSFWLLNNYLNYQYETEEALVLLEAYNKLKASANLASVADYLAITDEVNNLYVKFVNMFNYNRIVNFRSGITASDAYYLSYRYNDEYVCEKYLKDTELFDEKLHTDIYQIEVEREVLVEVLEEEKRQVNKYRNDSEILSSGLHFEHKENSRKSFIASMTMLLGLIALVLAYLIGWYNSESYTNILFVEYTNPAYSVLPIGTTDLFVIVNYALLGMLGLAVIMNMIATAKYHRLSEAYDLIDSIEKETNLMIKAIDDEERIIVNPTKKPKYRIITRLNDYKENREDDLVKLKRISSKKTSVNRSLIVLGNILFVLPFTVIVLSFITQYLEFPIYELLVAIKEENMTTTSINLVPLIIFVVNTLLVILLRKKNFIYYLFILCLVALVALSIYLL